MDALVKLVAPWADFYAEHTAVATTVAFLHLAGILFGGGRAVVADLAALRARSGPDFVGAGQLRFLASSHRDVLAGLGVVVVSGLLLFTSDLEHHLESRLYWLKMGLVAVLLVNGVLIRRHEAGLGADPSGPDWGATRRHAAISLVCWFAVILLGKAVVNS